MPRSTTNVCEARGNGCGSPTGWRHGGRCRACRRAHNAETNQYRRRGRLRGADRAVVLAALRDGQERADAAALVGRTAAGLEHAAAADGELRLALDEAPTPMQRSARAGDYLAAMTRHGGSRAAARDELGISQGEVKSWQRTLPGFHDAEKAVAGFARDPRVPPRRRISDDQLERAAEALENGRTMQQAAAAAGVRAPSLRNNAERCPRLNAALAPLTPQHERQPRQPRKRSHATDRLLRKLWPDPTLTIRDIASRLGASPATTRVWATALELPTRRGIPLTMQHQRDAAAQQRTDTGRSKGGEASGKHDPAREDS